MAAIAHRIWNELLTFFAICFLIAFSYPAFTEYVSHSAQTRIGSDIL